MSGALEPGATMDSLKETPVSTAKPDAVVSRRRMAFRPAGRCVPTPFATRSATPGTFTGDAKPAVVIDAKPLIVTDSGAETSNSCDAGAKVSSSAMQMAVVAAPSWGDDHVDIATTTSVVAPTTSAEVTAKKTSKWWTQDEILTYYEGVKLYGKDFESISRMMAKRKVNKDKDQIKNLYYNSIKFIRGLVGMEADDSSMYPEICKDAKELFFVINSCEWRKRTGVPKYQPERLRELIVEGSTTIPFRGAPKKRVLQIKTPTCPALQKYFTLYRRVEKDKFPSEITIFLRPLTYADANYVIGCEQNPLIRMRISTSDALTRIFELLHRKWTDPIAKQGCASAISPNIRIGASRCTEIGSVALVESQPTDEGAFSMNRLVKETRKIAAAHASRYGEDTNAVPSYTAIVPSPLLISADTVKEGLTLQNVGDATIAELYCLCGMTPEIQMVYSIENDLPRPHAWNVLSGLLGREYGEAAAEIEENGELNDNGEVDSDGGDEIERPGPLHPESRKPSTSSDWAAPTAAPIPPAEPVPMIESSVVVDEIDAFGQQLLFLEEKRRERARRGTNKSVAKPKHYIPQQVPQVAPQAHLPTIYLPAPCPKERQFHSPFKRQPMQSMDVRASICPLPERRSEMKPPIHLARAADHINDQRPRRSRSDQQAKASLTDFSHCMNPGDATALLASLGTPEKTLSPRKVPLKRAGCSVDETKQRKMIDLFGEMSKSPLRELTTLTPVTNNSCKQSRLTQEEDLFGDVSLTPSKFNSVPIHESESMQGIFNSTMNEMMSQNSVDFYKEFEPLLDSVKSNTPKKRKIKRK